MLLEGAADRLQNLRRIAALLRRQRMVEDAGGSRLPQPCQRQRRHQNDAQLRPAALEQRDQLDCRQLVEAVAEQHDLDVLLQDTGEGGRRRGGHTDAVAGLDADPGQVRARFAVAVGDQKFHHGAASILVLPGAMP